ncbi:DUF1697 domain-containing protein [Curtobacterium sp. MCBD17_021]|uniref:DUF1697 domain-containing protein n=1 Tax=Curtobacterium sp. MCBD17_021 TaxID=2175665 RepID=UPI0021ABEF5F|nr:DUF1697 domain-containing protein [Curtobacterium sp. MCBD17_021]
MTRWVALLRGVNVNGITIRSAELVELFRALGHTDVRTVLASGGTSTSRPAVLPTPVRSGQRSSRRSARTTTTRNTNTLRKLL